MADDDNQQAYQAGPVAYRTGAAAYGPRRQFNPAVDQPMVVNPRPSPSYDPLDEGYLNAFPGMFIPSPSEPQDL